MIDKMPARRPRVWALLGAHQGDNNQVLALAEALALPFERKNLTYNRWRHFQPWLLGATFRSLTKESRDLVSGDLPDLTISTGHRSVPVVRAIRRRSAGRTRSVHLGYPRISPVHFDLVVATAEYPVPRGPHVMQIPLALTRGPTLANERDDDQLLCPFPRPRRLLILGGPTLYWRLDPNDVLSAISQLENEAAADSGSLLVVASPRTPRVILSAAQKRLVDCQVPSLFVATDGPPNYRTVLANADAIFVTADSVAMISDAVSTGQPVSLVPIRPTRLGSAYMATIKLLMPGGRMYPRDLRHFWKEVTRCGFASFSESHLGNANGPLDLSARVAERIRGMLAGEDSVKSE